MAFALPDAVACFFAASNSGDAALLLPHLADAVVVHDEGRQHHGAVAVAAWLAHPQATTPYRAMRLDARMHGDATCCGAGFGRLPAEPAATGACAPVGGRQDCGAAHSLMHAAW